MTRWTMGALLLLLAVPLLAGAQPWMAEFEDWDREPTFAEVVDAFDAYWDGREVTKGSGYKPFMRWRTFMETRLDEEGRYHNGYRWNAWADRQARFPGSNLDEADWTPQGPFEPQIGSYVGGLGRINCIAIDPTDPNHIYAGAASGGLWETFTGGYSWVPLTDHLPVLGVSDVEIDPTNPDIMYMATGDRDGGDTPSIGMLKSTDAGQSWNNTGLFFDVLQFARVSHIELMPGDPQTILAATSYGIYRSTDGGNSFSVPLSLSNMDEMEVKPDDPNVWLSCRGGDGVYRSNDGGLTWNRMNNGLPDGGFGRIIVAWAPSDPNVAYALYTSTNSSFYGLYKSFDAGLTWYLQSNTPNIMGWEPDGSGGGGQAWYDIALAVHPDDANTIYVGGVNLWKSVDGGSSWDCTGLWYYTDDYPYIHADQHRFRWHGDQFYVGNDGGVYVSDDSGDSWEEISHGLVAQQIYRLGVSQWHPDPDVWLIGNQDNGTKLNTPDGTISVIGGDGMECAINPLNPNYMYGTVYYGALYRSTDGGSSWDDATDGIDSDGAWVTPFVIDPVNPNRMWLGTNKIYRTTNAGDFWTPSSPSTGGGYGDRMSAMAIAPSDNDVVYAVNPNGDLLVTVNGGGLWTERDTPADPPTYIAVHPQDPNIIYVTFGTYYLTEKLAVSYDAGETWDFLGADLPNSPLNCVLVHPENPDHVYVGSDIGVFFSDDGGDSWTDWSAGLPNVIVNEMELHASTNTIVAATYGRGVWTSPAEDPDAGPATLDLTGTTTVVPASGGNVIYDVAFSSTLPNTVPGLMFWTMVTTPNGQEFGPLFQQPFTHTPFMEVNVIGMAQAVPASAPAGDYTFTGHIGFSPNPILTDAFAFTKEGAVTDGTMDDLSGWVARGRFFESTELAAEPTRALPTEFGLGDAYPNPFNPTTVVPVTLPAASELTVAVYNTTGQQVAVLHDGRMAAGNHSFQWDAGDLASGVYFVRAQVPGELDATRKLTLMK